MTHIHNLNPSLRLLGKKLNDKFKVDFQPARLRIYCVAWRRRKLKVFCALAKRAWGYALVRTSNLYSFPVRTILLRNLSLVTIPSLVASTPSVPTRRERRLVPLVRRSCFFGVRNRACAQRQELLLCIAKVVATFPRYYSGALGAVSGICGRADAVFKSGTDRVH